MLTHTFLHVPGIGYTTEQRLWQRGVHCWTDALALPEPPRSFPSSRWGLVQDTVEGSQRSLAAGDHRYFAQLLHARDHWRAFPEFRQRVGYLDIETDGMDFYHSVTVVGLYDGVRTHTYVAGDNLDQLAEDLPNYSLLVTFNGATFDLPFLRRRFGDIFDQLHIDLRYALARLGHHGGLKAIERRLGIARNDEIVGLMGDDAVRLWHEYQRGSSEALELLVEYNRADVENLETLMDLAYDSLWRHATEGTGPS